jgi:hypothetical protein
MNASSLSLAALVLSCAGCSKETKDAPSPIAKVERKPAEDASLAIPPEKAHDAAPQADEMGRLAGEILEQNAAASSSKTESTIWSQSYDFEGVGSIEVFRKLGADKPQVFAEFEIGDESHEAARQAARSRLAKELRDGSYVRLERTEWESDDATLSIPGTKLSLKWSPPKLSVVGPEGKSKVLGKYRPDPPHRPQPTAVFTSSDSPSLVVEMTYYPGKKYQEGYTVRVVMDAYSTLD